MLIGIDLDNTIINYESVFNSLAKKNNLVPLNFTGNKVELKSYIKAKPQGSEEWMRLQGQVYSIGINEAVMMEGFIDFMVACKSKNINTVIISHKTEKGHYVSNNINLREVALSWLDRNLFASKLSLVKNEVHFEETQEAKIKKIIELNCTHFIDDLYDLLIHPFFPKKVKSYLLNQSKEPILESHILHFSNWHELGKNIFPNG